MPAVAYCYQKQHGFSSYQQNAWRYHCGNFFDNLICRHDTIAHWFADRYWAKCDCANYPDGIFWHSMLPTEQPDLPSSLIEGLMTFWPTTTTAADRFLALASVGMGLKASKKAHDPLTTSKEWINCCSDWNDFQGHKGHFKVKFCSMSQERNSSSTSGEE